MKNRYIISSFSYPTKDLLVALKMLNKLIGRGHKRYYKKCDIYTLRDRVILKIPGQEIYLKCEPVGFCKASLYFSELYDAVKDHKDEVSTFEIGNKDTRLNNRMLTSNAAETNPDDKLVMQQLDLGTINTEVYDSVSFLNHHDRIFLQKNGWELEHINNLVKDAEKAAVLLSKYEVSSYELIELVKAKMNIV